MKRPNALKRWLGRGIYAGLLFLLLAGVAWLLLPLPPLYPDELTFSRQVLDRDGKLLHLTLSGDDRYRIAAKLGAISPEVVRATIEKEDRRFYSHAGVDLRSVARAMCGVASRQRLGGASTLTMQYARLRWKLNTRSIWGKCVQMFRAIQLERHYSKQQLLEAYLTLAPYGGNVEGVEAASLLWFGKRAHRLTEREAAALAVLPQRPAARHPAKGSSPELAAAQARLLARLRGASEKWDAEFAFTPTSVPRGIPHLTRRVLRAAGAQAVVRTTIDANAQSAMEVCVTDFIARRSAQGLRNAAAILVHAPSREVRAYVGSVDFFNERICGQVDGVRARRSPGSALKPFIYALALDAGLIHPATLVDDAPRQFGAYEPENSDRMFLGPIPADEALRRSRNIPAIELQARLPNGGLDRFLRAHHVQLRRPAGAYGLSLALGGAEVSLEELTGLYASLASDGMNHPLRFECRPGDERVEGSPLLSPPARWLAVHALQDAAGVAPRGLACKTGTSHGFRDAWACGVMGEWVLCVWIGHCDGASMPGLFARETAAPLLYEMIRILELNAEPIPSPAEIVKVALCGDSGMIAGGCCPHVRRGDFIAGVSPIGVCEVHREVFLDDAGFRVSAGTPQARKVVREFWPAHRLEQFRQAGLPRSAPPAWAPGHEEVAGENRLTILSPQSTLTYVLQPAHAERRSILLKARASAAVRRIHWFAGPQYLGAAAPDSSLSWVAPAGRWEVSATDEFGNSSNVVVNVAHAGPPSSYSVREAESVRYK